MSKLSFQHLHDSSLRAAVISHVIWLDEVFVHSSRVEFEAAVVRTDRICRKDHKVTYYQAALRSDTTQVWDLRFSYCCRSLKKGAQLPGCRAEGCDWSSWWLDVLLDETIETRPLVTCSKGLLNKRWCAAAFIEIENVERKKKKKLSVVCQREGVCGFEGT